MHDRTCKIPRHIFILYPICSFAQLIFSMCESISILFIYSSKWDNEITHHPRPQNQVLSDSLSQYLESVRPLLTDPKFKRMTELANQFESNLGNRLQRYLKLKALWATNYVSVLIHTCTHQCAHSDIQIPSYTVVKPFHSCQSLATSRMRIITSLRSCKTRSPLSKPKYPDCQLPIINIHVPNVTVITELLKEVSQFNMFSISITAGI